MVPSDSAGRRGLLILAIAAAVCVAVAVGILLWTHVPPGASSTAEILTLVNSYEAAVTPAAPEGAVQGRPLTPKQIAALEREVGARMRELMTPELYQDSVVSGRLALLVAMDVSDAIASGSPWPPTEPHTLSALKFIRRTMSGQVIVQVVEWKRTVWNNAGGPFLIDQYVLSKTNGAWKIAGQKHLGMTRNGKVTPNVGG